MPANSPPLVAVIILNWNNWRDTVSCVDACRRLSWPQFRILVVDNHSTDQSAEMLRLHCPDVELIETGANLGFAGGNNIGIRRALELGAEFVWLLNNDAVPAPDALEALVKALSTTPEAACATSKIYYMHDPQKIWFAGGAWSKGCLRLRQQGAGQIDTGQFDRIREIGSVTGCSMLVPAAMIHIIGFLDERYFLYWEDTDWSARAVTKKYKLLFVPDSHVWHKVSATIESHSTRHYYYFTRNGLHFCRKYDRTALPWLLLYLVVDVTVGAVKGNTEMLGGFLKGCADFLRGRYGQQVKA